MWHCPLLVSSPLLNGNSNHSPRPENRQRPMVWPLPGWRCREHLSNRRHCALVKRQMLLRHESASHQPLFPNGSYCGVLQRGWTHDRAWKPCLPRLVIGDSSMKQKKRWKSKMYTHSPRMRVNQWNAKTPAPQETKQSTSNTFQRYIPRYLVC